MLKARHNWIASRITDGFGVSEEEARAVVRKHYVRVAEFLKADGPSQLLTFCQPREFRNEVSA